MTILAIDPGPTHSAFVVWDGEAIHRASKWPNSELLSNIPCLGKTVDYVACELIQCYGMPVGKEVFDTAYFSGRIWERVVSMADNAGHFSLVSRRDVKLHLCGQARAKDGNIRQALIDRFGAKGTKKEPGLTYNLKADTWQAFALAVTCFDKPDLMK